MPQYNFLMKYNFRVLEPNLLKLPGWPFNLLSNLAVNAVYSKNNTENITNLFFEWIGAYIETVCMWQRLTYILKNVSNVFSLQESVLVCWFIILCN